MRAVLGFPKKTRLLCTIARQFFLALQNVFYMERKSYQSVKSGKEKNKAKQTKQSKTKQSKTKNN